LDAGLGFLTVDFPDLRPTVRVVWVRFNEFIWWDPFNIEDRASIEKVHVDTKVKGGLKLLVICLPYNDLEIRSIEVTVEEGHPLIRDEEGTNIRERKFIRFSSLTALGNILEVSSTSKGILRGCEAEGLSTTNVVRASHPAVFIERCADKGRKKYTEGSVLLDSLNEWADKRLAGSKLSESVIIESRPPGSPLNLDWELEIVIE
jgi:hypothetical protein